MERWGVGAALQHKMCSGGGTNETIRPIHIRIDLMGDREGEDRLGDVTINCLGGTERETRHNNIVLKSGGRSKPSKAGPALKHNNKPQRPSIFIANELTMQIQSKTTIKQATIILEERWRNLQICCLSCVD
jgi:hypothetical protein